MIVLRDVCKTYQVGDEIVRALDHASLTVQDGEFVSIIGPSGSGKSAGNTCWTTSPSRTIRRTSWLRSAAARSASCSKAST